MKVKLLSAESGIGSKTGQPWFKAYLKLVNDDGKTNIMVEWLGSNAGIKAIEWCKNGNEPWVEVHMGYDDFFRKTILDLKRLDADIDVDIDNEVII